MQNNPPIAIFFDRVAKSSMYTLYMPLLPCFAQKLELRVLLEKSKGQLNEVKRSIDSQTLLESKLLTGQAVDRLISYSHFVTEVVKQYKLLNQDNKINDSIN